MIPPLVKIDVRMEGCEARIDGVDEEGRNNWLHVRRRRRLCSAHRVDGVAPTNRGGVRGHHREVGPRAKFDQVMGQLASDEGRFTDYCREQFGGQCEEQRNRCESLSVRVGYGQHVAQFTRRKMGNEAPSVAVQFQLSLDCRTHRVLVDEIRSRAQRKDCV